MNLFFRFIFIIVSIFILIQTISYALYEINTNNNKSGGIAVICFSVLVIVFTNVMVFINP
jgi:hypothetical protein